MRIYEYIIAAAALVLSVCGCALGSGEAGAGDDPQPQFLDIEELPEGGYSLTSISPFDGSRDTLVVDRPLRRLIVMSTSHIGFLRAIGSEEAVVGVSGSEYVCDTAVARMVGEGTVLDVGYEAAPDYEKILGLKPDLLLTYSVSAAESRFISRLKSLGIRTFIVNEHLESHPLARAAYVRLFGALTGKMAAADSVLRTVSAGYTALRDSVRKAGDSPRKILVNIPYKDQWYIPGGDNYLTTLFRDAGGQILGAATGTSVSRSTSIEEAYGLSKEADIWMDVSWCSTRSQLLEVNPLFEDFIGNISRNAEAAGLSGESIVWNDNKRLNPKGGNDFWESGVTRPDLLLRDLTRIFHPAGEQEAEIIYYREVR